VKVSLCEDRQPSDLGVGSIGNDAKDIIDLEHEIHFNLEGELSGDDLHGCLESSDRFIDEFSTKV
jgi:hypothetical protein